MCKLQQRRHTLKQLCSIRHACGHLVDRGYACEKLCRNRHACNKVCHRWDSCHRASDRKQCMNSAVWQRSKNGTKCVQDRHACKQICGRRPAGDQSVTKGVPANNCGDMLPKMCMLPTVWPKQCIRPLCERRCGWVQVRARRFQCRARWGTDMHVAPQQGTRNTTET